MADLTAGHAALARGAWAEARATLRADAGTHFDPAIVEAYDTIPDEAFQRIGEGIA